MPAHAAPASPGWQPPILLSDDARTYIEGPHLVADENGNFTELFMAGPNRDVFARQRLPDQSWEPPVRITNQTGSNYSWAPMVSVGPGASLTALWIHDASNNRTLWSARFSPATGWGPPELVGPWWTGGFNDLTVATGAGAFAVAAWIEFNFPPEANVAWASVRDGSGWSAPVALESRGDFSAGTVRAAADGNGNGLIVWNGGWQGLAGKGELWASWYRVGSGWASPENLSSPQWIQYLAPAAVAEPDGNFTVFYSGSDCCQDTGIRVRRASPGRPWSAPETITPDGTYGGNRPRVAVGAAGDVFVAWQGYVNGSVRPFATRYRPGAGANETALLLNASDSNISDLSVAADGRGNAMVVWGEQWPANTGLRAARFAAVGGWGPPIHLTVDGQMGQFYGEVALAPSGNGTASWYAVNATNATHFDFLSREFVPATAGAGPALNVESPLPGAFFEQPWVEVRGTAPGAAFVVIQGHEVQVAPNGTFKTPVSLARGPNNITVGRADDAHRATVLTLPVVFDAHCSLTITRFPTGPFNHSNVTIAGMSDPGARVSALGVEQTADAQGRFSLNVNATEGEQDVEVVAIDAAGNQNFTIVHLMIDTVAPTLEVTEPNEGAQVQGPMFFVAGRTEPGLTVQIEDVAVDANSAGFFHSIVNHSAGAYRIIILVQDEAGNGARVERNVTVMGPPSGPAPRFISGFEGSSALLGVAAAAAMAALPRRRR